MPIVVHYDWHYGFSRSLASLPRTCPSPCLPRAVCRSAVRRSTCCSLLSTSSLLSSVFALSVLVRLAIFSPLSHTAHMSTTPEIDELASPPLDDLIPVVSTDAFSLTVKQEDEEKVVLKTKPEYYCLGWPEGRKPSHLDDTWGKWVLRSTLISLSSFSNRSEYSHPLHQPRPFLAANPACPRSRGGKNITESTSIVRIMWRQRRRNRRGRMRR